MDQRTRDFVKRELLMRAEKKPEFRHELLRDPKAAIKAEFGMDLPADVDLRVAEETGSLVWVILPMPAPNRESTVTLREVTEGNVRAVCALEVQEEQRRFVAPNATSIAEAHFNPKAWFRAIYADETPVGFVQILDDPDTPRYYVWRYMVDGRYQGCGFGKRAMEQVIDYVRSRPNAKELTLSYVPGDGSPRDFYAGLGFVETGEEHFGEREMRLEL